MDNWVWTWSGVSFGYVDGDALFTYDGRHVGFVDRSASPPAAFRVRTGEYLGELGDVDRLLTRRSRMQRRRPPRSQRARRMSRMRRMNRMGRIMRVGCEDFPVPEDL